LPPSILESKIDSNTAESFITAPDG
jgi:hypothetical protein